MTNATPLFLYIRYIYVVLVAIMMSLPVVVCAGKTPEEVQSFEACKAKAEKGDASAQLNLAIRYENGEGTDKNLPEAVVWYHKAAEQGNAGAQLNLGYLYRHGEGVTENKALGLSLYRKAAERGLANAQLSLGAALTDEDPKQSEVWILKAAEQGYVTAQLELGKRYQGGFGVVQDSQRGYTWYLRAAEQGSAEGQFHVGTSLFVGVGIDKDEVKAASWLRKAFEQGHIGAHHWLAGCYLRGDGVPKDAIEGYAIYNLAGVTDSLAKVRLAELELKMTRDEISAGQKRTRELKKEIDVIAATKLASSGLIQADISKATGAADSKPLVDIESRQVSIDSVIANAPWLILLAFVCVIIGVFSCVLIFKKVGTAARNNDMDHLTSDIKPAHGFLSRWALSSLAILALLSVLGYLNGGLNGLAVQLGRGLIIAPLGGLVLGVVWKLLSK